jgi:zinc-ribbon domain
MSETGTIATLGEELKEVLEGVQDKYESFIDDAQLYKKGKIDDVNFFYKLSEYLLDLSKINSLEARFVLEIKSNLDAKGGKWQEAPQLRVSDKITDPATSAGHKEGNAVRRSCTSCGAEINIKAKFCRSCGKSQG